MGLGQHRRARALLQLGNAFKLQGLWAWLEQLRASPEYGASNPRFHPRLHTEYTIGSDQLQGGLEVPLLNLKRWRRPLPPSVEIHSLCHYGPESQGGAPSDGRLLAEMSTANHRAYAAKQGHSYHVHTELPRPELEPQFNKIALVIQALEKPGAAEWVLFIDCDAFFTNFDVGVGDVMESYGAGEADGPHFLVAEDPGGINTGVFLVRNVRWSLEYLRRVERNAFRVAWDQSMFFWEVLMPSLLDGAAARSGRDFALPREVCLVHQAHLNAFVPPASRDWHAYEWRPGDFVRHFAGCRVQEAQCYQMMAETAQYAMERWPHGAAPQPAS